MKDKVHPIVLDDERLEQANGGADAAQRSHANVFTVTFGGQLGATGDPDRPIVLGSVYNPEKPR